MTTSIEKNKWYEEVIDTYEERGCEILERNWSCEDAQIDMIAYSPIAGVYIFADFCLPGPDGSEAPNEDLSERARERYQKVLAAYAAHRNITIERSRYDSVHVGVGKVCGCIHRRLAVFGDLHR